MRLARIVDNVVAEVTNVPDTFGGREAKVDDFFHPGMGFEAVATDVEPGFQRHAEGGFAKPQEASGPDPDEEKSRLKTYAAARRYDREVRGVAIDGLSVPTDSFSQFKIAELYRRAGEGKIRLPFEFKSGEMWTPVDLDTLKKIDQAIATHIEDCYARNRNVDRQIDSGFVTKTADIDSAFE